MNCPQCHVKNLDLKKDDICYWCGTVLNTFTYHIPFTRVKMESVQVVAVTEEAVSNTCAGSYLDIHNVVTPTEDCSKCGFRIQCKDTTYIPF